MSDPVFGFGFNVVSDETLPAITADMSVIGLVGTAPSADVNIFPVNTPVRFFSDNITMLAALGSDGTLYQSVAAINEQLGEFEVAATVVVVRVTVGTSTAQTIANCLGDINARTGMYALLDSPALLGVTPRLIAVPGFTSQPANGVTAVTVTAQGVGYTAVPTVTFSGGGSDPGKVLPTGHAVLGTGPNADKIASVVVDTMGSNLTAAPTVAFTGGTPTTPATATAALDSAANAVTAGLSTLLDRLFAVAVVDGPSSTQNAATAWRATISSKRIIPHDPYYKDTDSNGAVITVPASPHILGIAVKRDHQFQGRPFHSWANQPVAGIVGTARPIGFSLLDGSTEGQALLAQNIGVTVRGENTDGAIADGGYVYVGTDTCSPDPLWTFYNQVRGRDYIHIAFIKTLRFFLGRYNLTGHALQAVINTMESFLLDLKARDDILGFKVGFDRDLNSPEQMRLGRFTVSFAAEEPAVLRHLTVQSARYRPALDALLTDLMAQLDVVA